MQRYLWAAMLLGCAVQTPASAQRTIEVPATASWKHADTGIILGPQIEGMVRLTIRDSTAAERDVSLNYETPDRALLGTVFIFHSALAEVPIWFDRADTAIRTRALFAGARAVGAAPVAFAPPGGATSASALRQTYATGGGDYRATSLAVLPINGWLVAVRLSARNQDAGAIDATMSRMLSAIRWPAAGGTTAPAAIPVSPCPTPLSFRKAKPVKASMEDMLLGSLMGLAASQAAKPESDVSRPPSTPLCRDPSSTTDYGVFRGEGAGYVMALGDAGRTVDVTPGLDGMVSPTTASRMTISLTDVDDSRYTFGSFTALPRPAQVMDMIRTTAPTAKRAINGKKIEVSLPSK